MSAAMTVRPRLLRCCGGVNADPADHMAGCPMAGVPAPGVCTCGSRRGCEVHGPQPREHNVPCGRCGRMTLNVDGWCDPCGPRPVA